MFIESLPQKVSNGNLGSATLSRPIRHSFHIADIRQSESAWVVFARHELSKRLFVLKFLKAYKDSRYSLSTSVERQKCMLEALHWNRKFTPGVFIGLGHICNFENFERHRRIINLDQIIENPTIDKLIPGAEYALIMYPLPEGKRLDYLLSEADGASLSHYMRLLIKRVVEMHRYDVPLAGLDEDGNSWGSYTLLKKKLLENFDFLDLALTTIKNGFYKSYYPWLKDLRQKLPRLLALSRYPEFFERRVREKYIRRCHSDLKTPNIWIAPRNGEQDEYVWLLDTIDFNPMFCNIDVLSDFAMLAIDVQVRVKSQEITNKMIEDYLELTGQQDEVSRSVLAYYLVEKAIITAAVSLIDDKLPSISRDFLEVARIRTNDLMALIEDMQCSVSEAQSHFEKQGELVFALSAP